MKLTEKQKLFCQYYVEYYNATRAYLKVYDCKYTTARTNGARTLAKAGIKAEVKRLQKLKDKEYLIRKEDVFRKWLEIAFSDMSEFVEWSGNKCKIKNSREVNSSLISEISETKEGIKIKLVDKIKALEYLNRHFDLFPDQWRREFEEKKLEKGEKIQAEIKIGFDEDEEPKDD